MDENEAEILGSIQIALLNALLAFDEESMWRQPLLRLSKTLDAVLSDQPEAI